MSVRLGTNPLCRCRPDFFCATWRCN